MSLTFALFCILLSIIAYLLGALTGRHYALISIKELSRVSSLLPHSKAPRDAITEHTETPSTRIISPSARQARKEFEHALNQ